MYKPKQRTTTKCNGCGKPILFITPKGGKAIPVESTSFNFLPGEDGERFIQSDGKERRGRQASDGLKGFKPHICGYCVRTQLSEKEIARRSYY